MPSMSRSRVILAGLILAGSLMGQAQAAGDAQRGKQIGYTCLGCHGIENYKNVYPTYSVPKLVGQHPEYIKKQLQDFKAKRRTNDAGNMTSVAHTLSDEDIENLSHYIANLQ